MNRILVAGNLIIDQNKSILSYPSKGMLSKIVDVNNDVGGFVPNYCIDLKRIDPNLDICALGLVGRDDNAKFILNKLNENSIDTSMVISSDCPTSFTDVMNVINGERTFFQFGGSNDLLSLEHFDLSKIECDLFHIGYLLLLNKLDEKDDEYGTKMARLLASISAKGIKTSIDVVSEDSNRFTEIVTPSLKYVNYMVVNEIEAGTICGLTINNGGKFNLSIAKEAIDKLFELGVKEFVCIHSPEVAIAKEINGDFVIVPSLLIDKSEVVNTSGAGDAFCSAVLYGLISKKPIKDTLELGHAAAVSCLKSKTTTGGACSYEELKKINSRYKRREL